MSADKFRVGFLRGGEARIENVGPTVMRVLETSPDDPSH